jgi:hypothetical protein
VQWCGAKIIRSVHHPKTQNTRTVFYKQSLKKRNAVASKHQKSSIKNQKLQNADIQYIIFFFLFISFSKVDLGKNSEKTVQPCAQFFYA